LKSVNLIKIPLAKQLVRFMKDPLQMLRSSIAMAAESGETEIKSYTLQLLLN
jgi:hypothetical protein